MRETNIQLSGRSPKSRRMKGVLFLEAAVLLPPIILAGFGYLSIVDYLAERTAIDNSAHAVAMALQENPKMNATELYTVVRASGSSTTPFVEKTKSGGSSNTSCDPSVCEIDGLTVSVMAKGTMPDFPHATILDHNNDHANWKNPHSADNNHQANASKFGGSLQNDSSPYFVGVRLEWTPKLPFVPFNLGTLAKITRTAVVPVKDRDYSPTSLRFKVEGRMRWNNLIRSYCEQLPGGTANPKCAKAITRCAIDSYTDKNGIPENDRLEKISDKFKAIRSRPGCLRRACRGAFPGKDVVSNVVSAYRIASCNVFQGLGVKDPRDQRLGTRANCPAHKISMKAQCFFSDIPISEQTWENLVPEPLPTGTVTVED